MSPREKLFQFMAGGWSLTEAESAPLYQAIDDFAHDLAELQRREADDLHQTEPGVVKGLRIGADLIDPSGAGPVRPQSSEETTA